MRSRPGSWQPIKTETTYGSDAFIPALNEHCWSDWWKGALVRDIGNRPVTVKGSFDYCGKSYSYKTEAEPAADAIDVDRVLALQNQIRDGTLTLANALKEINGDDQPVQQFIAKYLFTASNILQDSFLFNFDNSVLFDLCINGENLAPGDGIKIAHRLGEVPASGVYSTINYKVASVSKVDDGVWTVRAVRVGTSDSEPAPTADDQLTLVERVADAIDNTPLGERHRAAIREMTE